jgi:Uma2 family endonuclease
MTLNEFLVWDADDATGRRWRLIDGEPMPMALATAIHRAIQHEFGALRRNYRVAVGRQSSVIGTPRILPHGLTAVTRVVRS